jgi:hypothetical protein
MPTAVGTRRYEKLHTINAADYDLGRNRFAYYDLDSRADLLPPAHLTGKIGIYTIFIRFS